ncbi:MAG: phenylalanine--tRNA ligase subunit beta [Patescibacteria group bacterium]
MLLSLNWLKEYVDIKETPERVADLFTMHSAEVEAVKPQAQLLEKVVVGQIKKIKKHPNADKLQIVDTAIGKDNIVQIVCGGTNLKENMFVAVAKIGAQVKWHGEGDLVTLEKVKIRGEESNGMICLDSEIGLGKNIGTEIMDLSIYTDQKLKIGQSLGNALDLNDYIIEIDNKSLTHRSDLFCHIGMAREYAAITNRQLKLPKFSKIKCLKEKYKLNIEVEDYNDTIRYMSIVLDDIKIAPAPLWMQRRLEAVGIRSINNVVDITNFLMMEYGHPVHAFDYQKINGQLFRIRRAKKGEFITTLDGEKRKLDESILIIEDSNKITDLAGIMGGQTSEINANTKTIAFEVADFNKTLIRKTANKLGLRTEAVVRYEKGLGLDLSDLAMARGVSLFEEYAGAKVASKLYDKKKINFKPKTINLNIDLVKKNIGIEIKRAQIISILNNLQLAVKDKKTCLEVTIPVFRTDLNIPEDLIEEISRIYGYDNIPLMPLQGYLEPTKQLPDLEWGDYLSQKLASWGFNEVMNYSFYGDREIEKSLFDEQCHVQIANPLSEEQKYLRIALLPHLLSNISKNLKNNFTGLKLFEIGHVYYPNSEYKILNCALTGDNRNIYFTAKGIMEALLKETNIKYHIYDINKNQEKKRYLHNMFDTNTNAAVVINDKVIGVISSIKKQVLDNFGINNFVACFSFDLIALSKQATTSKKYKPLCRYPEVNIDLSIIVDNNIKWQEAYNEIIGYNELIKSVELFDVYQGDKIEQNKKSFAMHIVFQDENKTLAMKDIEMYRDNIMKLLNTKFHAILRDK